MSARETVRIGLIGAGRMGFTHLGALERARAIEVAGVVEPAALARARVALRGHRVHERVEELLGAGGVDGLLIAAPSDQHLALLHALAPTGLPVLCEKPVGIHAADAVAAAGLVRERGIAFQVGYWRRFVPVLRELRERIAAGALGELYQVTCWQWDAEPPADSFRAHSGGIAVDMGVHEFDQARWLTGQEVAWVCAAPGAEGAPGAADPDAALILAGLDGGAACTISLGRRFPHGDCCWVEVLGSAGYVRLPFMWGTEGQDVFEAALVAQVEAFADHVRSGGPQAGAGALDAVAALTAAELAGESLDDGARREVPPAVVA